MDCRCPLGRLTGTRAAKACYGLITTDQSGLADTWRQLLPHWKLAAAALEILEPAASAAQARVGLFDFDGTLSLIRAGWIDVMVPMMVEILLDLGTGESEQELTALVEGYVGHLTGRQTIYQMIEFAEQVSKRGGKPKDPLEYKHIYLDRLMGRIRHRREGLRSGRIDPDELMVPGARRLLDAMLERGLKLYLASGTDQAFMREEANLLRIDSYFAGGMHGALDDYKSFSKKILVERIISASDYRGAEFLGFGDGFVEIEVVKGVGGSAVGVATDEPDCVNVDRVKRDRLAAVGADWIVPNFNAHNELMSALFGTS